jgi:hypothetical protein
MAVNIKPEIFYDEAPCSLVDGSQHFGRNLLPPPSEKTKAVCPNVTSVTI